MRRRELLAVLGIGASTGCTVGYTRDRESGRRTETAEGRSLAEEGIPPAICEEDLRPDGFLAVDDPAFGVPEDWPDDPEEYRPLTPKPRSSDSRAGTARAIPINVLPVQEVINDDVGGPVVVTDCPICPSGMVAERRVAGAPAVFDVSGLPWKAPRIHTVASEKDPIVGPRPRRRHHGNLVVYDSRTGASWSQRLATGFCRPAAGTRLTNRPLMVATCGEWRAEHPYSTVLLPHPRSSVVDPPVTVGTTDTP
jgi:hypothetical protein